MRQVPMRPAAVRALDLVLAYGPKVALAASSFEIPRWDNGADRPQRIRQVDLLGAIAGLIDPVGGSIDVPRQDGSAQRISYSCRAPSVNALCQ